MSYVKPRIESLKVYGGYGGVSTKERTKSRIIGGNSVLRSRLRYRSRSILECVSGIVNTISGTIINWSSCMQKTVTLNPTESEYVVLDKCGQE